MSLELSHGLKAASNVANGTFLSKLCMSTGTYGSWSKALGHAHGPKPSRGTHPTGIKEMLASNLNKGSCLCKEDTQREQSAVNSNSMMSSWVEKDYSTTPTSLNLNSSKQTAVLAQNPGSQPSGEGQATQRYQSYDIPAELRVQSFGFRV